jgi:hypothetical protein
MSVVLPVISAIAIGKLVCLIGAIFLWPTFYTLRNLRPCQYCAGWLMACLRVLWALIRRLPKWLRRVVWFTATVAAMLALALSSPELSAPEQSNFGCKKAKVWSYEPDKRLVRLIDTDLDPLGVLEPTLSLEKDGFCQHAEAYIDSRSKMIQPFISLRDTDVLTWIEAQKDAEPIPETTTGSAAAVVRFAVQHVYGLSSVWTAGRPSEMSVEPPTEREAAVQEEIAEAAARIEVAFQSMRVLSSDCLDKSHAFQKSLNSALRAIDVCLAEVYKEAAEQQNTTWLLRKSTGHQQGLVNEKDRLERTRVSAAKLDRYTSSDPCMVELIESMHRDWRGFSQSGVAGARELEPLRRLWKYAHTEVEGGGEASGNGVEAEGSE